MDVQIIEAYGELDEIRRLFTEYTEWMGLDLSFQAYEEELASLPGHYAPPDGRLYLAKADGKTAGCVALRRFDRTRCEMKRLFVREEFRGQSLAHKLAVQVIRDAAAMGYSQMLLDTLSSMTAAAGLYRKLGFQEIPPYYHNPHPKVIYFEKDLMD